MIFGRPDQRLVKLSLGGSLAVAEKHLRENGYQVTDMTRSRDCVILRSETTCGNLLSLYLKRIPQVVHWQFDSKKDTTIIQIQFACFKSYSSCYLSILAAMLFLCVMGLVFSSYFWWAALAALPLPLFFSTHGTKTDRYDQFVDGFYQSCNDLTGKPAVQQDMARHPLYTWTLLPWMMISVPLSVSLISSNALGFRPLTVFLLLLAAALLVLGGVWERSPVTLARSTLLLQGISVCMAVIVYFGAFVCARPFVLALIPHGPHYGLIAVLVTSLPALLLSIFLCHSAISLSTRFFEVLEQFEVASTGSIWKESLARFTHSRMLDIWIYCFWAICTLAMICGVMAEISIVKAIVSAEVGVIRGIVSTKFGFIKTIAFSPSANLSLIYYSIIMVVLWTLFAVTILPTFIIPALVTRKYLQEIRERAELIRELTADERQLLDPLIKRLCHYAKTRVPKVLILKGMHVDAYISIWQELVVTEGTLRLFSEKELEVLLAHEIWHLKKHSKRVAILSVLSEWSFFGYGWLAITQNSYEMEFGADQCAFEWCRQNHISLEVLDTVLRRIEQVLAMHTRPARKHPLGISGLCLQREKPHPIVEKRPASWLGRFKADAKLFHGLYFTSEIISYFHPTFEERRNRIRELTT